MSKQLKQISNSIRRIRAQNTPQHELVPDGPVPESDNVMMGAMIVLFLLVALSVVTNIGGTSEGRNLANYRDCMKYAGRYGDYATDKHDCLGRFHRVEARNGRG